MRVPGHDASHLERIDARKVGYLHTPCPTGYAVKAWILRLHDLRHFVDSRPKMLRGKALTAYFRVLPRADRCLVLLNHASGK